MTVNHAPVSLVTGANKGIGLETVRRLVGAGHRVYLTARDAERGRLAAESVGANFIQLDGVRGQLISSVAARAVPHQ